MTRLCIVTGAIVLTLILASSGVLRGAICAGNVGCLAANHGGLTIKSAP